MARFKGTKKETAALGAFVKLMRAAESVSAAVHSPFSEFRLTVSQFGVLEALYHIGPLCQKELAEKILKSTGNMTTVIGNLEKRGLLTRNKSVEDGRYFVIELTEKGRDLIEKIFPAHANRIRERMSRLSAEEIKHFSRLCRKLGRDR